MVDKIAAPLLLHVNENYSTLQEVIRIKPLINSPAMVLDDAESQQVGHNGNNNGTLSSQSNLILAEEHPYVVQIVYPQELCLGPVKNVLKRGRPKKKKQENNSTNNLPEIATQPPKTARTRSGRLVKLPKHIEQDFKRIEITTEDQDVEVSDFHRFEEKENSGKIVFSEIEKKKRVISAQYRCPKCSKAYLGKSKMIQHLQKNPDHGPLPLSYYDYNFDVWNYLCDITQKCKSGQRGKRFCEELSNLLQNVQLLKNALFKTVSENKNCVQIDKILGNAIGLQPGRYQFDENELYKDVTLLKLINNSDLFKPIRQQQCDNILIKNEALNDAIVDCNSKEEKPIFVQKHEKDSDRDNKQTLLNSNKIKSTEVHKVTLNLPTKLEIKTTKVNETDFNNFSKKMDVDSQILSTDLLAENLLLHSIPNPRHSEEELMLPNVDNASSLLENSTSSDDVMNVDQFVNERFKKITETDMELNINNPALNLDLPSLELFQFHTNLAQ